MMNNRITLFVLSLLISGSDQAIVKADEITKTDDINNILKPDICNYKWKIQIMKQSRD